MRANIKRMDETFKSQKETLVAHIVVSHGFHIHHTNTELGNPDQGQVPYCSITGYKLEQKHDDAEHTKEVIIKASDAHVATKSS